MIPNLWKYKFLQSGFIIDLHIKWKAFYRKDLSGKNKILRFFSKYKGLLKFKRLYL